MKLAICAAAATLLFPALSHAEDKPAVTVPKFVAQEIDKSLKVGYGIRIADLNGDKKPDIVIADSERVIWFENPGSAGPETPWKLHTAVDCKKAGIKTDNVCIAVHDIDGDGKLDIALGADWQPGNTKAAGSLQWLKQPANIDEPWQVFPIFESSPTLHRINWIDVDGDGKPELVVGPLKGKDSTTAANNMDKGVLLEAYKIPKDPTKEKWSSELISQDLHVMHNFLPVRWMAGGKTEDILTASYEGVNVLTRTPANTWMAVQLGAGDQANPKASHGSSEIKLGDVKGRRLLATIEPFHGNQVVAYVQPTDLSKFAGKPWPRTVLDDTLKEGHGIWAADFDGDGVSEIVAGWRSGKDPGIRIFKIVDPTAEVPQWQKFDLDKGGVAVEDIACADLDGDGKIDIVAAGRATHNVKIYWNKGK